MKKSLGTTWALLANSRLARALSWTSAGTALVSIILFGRSALLARLLLPADYGIMGLAGVVTAAVATLTSFGLTSSIIPRDLGRAEDAAEVLDTVWTAELLRQVFVMLLLMSFAYPAAIYLGDRRVFPILLIIAVSPAIQGFSNIGMVLLQKTVEFRNVVLLRVYAELLATVGLGLLAYFIRNVFALAIGQLLTSSISVLLSYRFHPYRPRLRFKWEALRGSLMFSKSMLVISILTYVTTQFDNLVVGKHLGTTILGAYLLAYRLASLPVDMLGDVIGNVLFPVFARAQTAQQRNREMLLRHTVLLSITIFACVFLSVHFLSGEVIRIVYGGKWTIAGPMLSWLAFVGLFRGVARTFTPFLLGTNRADLDAKAKAMETMIFIPAVLVLVPRMGASGAALAGIVTYVVAALSRFLFVTRLIQKGRDLMIPVLILTVLIGACYAVSRYVSMLHAPAAAAAFTLCLLICLSFACVDGGRLRDQFRILKQTQEAGG